MAAYFCTEFFILQAFCERPEVGAAVRNEIESIPLGIAGQWGLWHRLVVFPQFKYGRALQTLPFLRAFKDLSCSKAKLQTFLACTGQAGCDPEFFRQNEDVSCESAFLLLQAIVPMFASSTPRQLLHFSGPISLPYLKWGEGVTHPSFPPERPGQC